MKIIIAFFITWPCWCLAQNDSTSNPSQSQLKGDTLFTQSGYKVIDGVKLKLGTGSMPDGDFKFIRRNAGSLFNYTGNQARANEANALPRNNAGLEYKVIRIDKRGTKKHGYVYYPIINVGMIRYEIDIDNAIATGEIAVPDEFKPKKESPVVVVKNEVSVADELTKLKKLYDDGVLTKEEYEAQKKKLLEKN